MYGHNLGNSAIQCYFILSRIMRLFACKEV